MPIGLNLFMLFVGLFLWLGGMYCCEKRASKIVCSVTGWALIVAGGIWLSLSDVFWFA